MVVPPPRRCKIETGFYDTRVIPSVTRQLVRTRLAASPAVALIGPRQCGKTTLARSLRGAYFDLEQESERLRFDLEWEEQIIGDTLRPPISPS